MNFSTNSSVTFLLLTTPTATTQMLDLRQLPERIIGSIVLIGIFLLTVLGNMVVIIGVSSYRQLKEQQSNLFIVNLAAADLGVALCVMVWSIITFISNTGTDKETNPIIYGMVICKMQCAMNYCLIVVSMVTLGFVSVDRYVHIIHPMSYCQKITKNKIRVMIIWSWIQGAIIGFIPVACNWIHFDYDEVVCAIDWSHRPAVTYVIAAFITCFVLPGGTMLFCYSAILKRSHDFSREIRNSQNKVRIPTIIQQLEENGDSNERTSSHSHGDIRGVKPTNGVERSHRNLSRVVKTTSRQHRRIIQSLLIVVLIFFICMTPFCVTKLIKVLQGHVVGWVNTFTTFIQLFASACNPFIYGIFRKEFRSSFRRQYNNICLDRDKLSITIKSSIDS